MVSDFDQYILRFDVAVNQADRVQVVQSNHNALHDERAPVFDWHPARPDYVEYAAGCGLEHVDLMGMLPGWTLDGEVSQSKRQMFQRWVGAIQVIDPLGDLPFPAAMISFASTYLQGNIGVRPNSVSAARARKCDD